MGNTNEEGKLPYVVDVTLANPATGRIIRQWLDENIGDPKDWIYYWPNPWSDMMHRIYEFRYEKDATLFALRWSNP